MKKDSHRVNDESPLDKADYNTAATIIESTAVLTKTYKLVDGKPTQETSANMAQGAATVKAFNTVHELAAILKGLKTNQAMSWGVVKNAHPEQSIQVLSRKKYEEQGRPKNAVARTNDFFEWGASGGVMMLDFDFKGDAMPKDQIMQTLYSIMPKLQESAFIWWCSSSSFIYNGDTQHSGLKGQRIYILVKDASDIERAGKVLFERLWLAGHGHFEISKAGSLLTRSIIDSSVWQPNRLDFISGANCIAPVQQKRPEPDIHDGAHLDTAIVLKDLTAAEQAQVAALKEKAKAKISPEANAVKNQFIETTAHKSLKVQRISNPSKEQVEQAKGTVKRAIKSDVLASDFVLYLDDMTAVTVGEILSNPNKYNDKLTKDPLEPDYDGGRTVGRLYLLDGKPNLHSQAHGGKNYKLINQVTHDGRTLPIYSLDEIYNTSEKTTAEILEQLKAENDPFECARLACAYAFKCLPYIPYKVELDAVMEHLGSYNDKLSQPTIDSIRSYMQRFLNRNKKKAIEAISIQDTKQHRHLVINNFDELTDPNYKGVILVKAPTGTSKTQKVGKPFAEWCKAGNIPFISIAHRVSLIDELCSRLQLDHYAHVAKDPARYIDSMAITVNSLGSAAFKDFIPFAKNVFIDEVTQGLAAFNSDTTFVGGKEHAFNTFKQLIINAECLIAADANINQATLRFIEECRPNEIFNIVEIKPTNEGKKAILYEEKHHLTSKVINDVMANGAKVWIACDTKNEAEKCHKVLSENYGINSLLITKDTKSKAVSDFLKNPEVESLKYDVIIANPKISSGISVEHRDSNGVTQPYFDYVVGIFTGRSVSSADAYQMLGRVRYATEFHLFIDQKYQSFIDADLVIKAKEQLSLIEGGTQKATALSRLIEEIEANSKEDLGNFANNLFYILEFYQFTFTRSKYQASEAIKAELAAAKIDLDEAEKDGILTASPIDEETANKYRKSMYLNQQQLYELKAYNKRMYLNLPFDAVLTEEHLEVNMAQVRRFNAVFGEHQSCKDKMLDIALRTYHEAAAKICKVVLKDLNIVGGAVFAAVDAEAILARIEPYKVHLAAIGFIPMFRTKETKTPAKRFNALLEHWGLKTGRVDNPSLRKKSDTLGHISIDDMREVSENDGSKVYRINGNSIAHMMQLTKEHLTKEQPKHIVTFTLDTVETAVPHASNESPYFEDTRESLKRVRGSYLE